MFAVYFKISNMRSAEEFLKYVRVSLLVNVKRATCFAEVAASSRRGRKVTDEAVSNLETSAYLYQTTRGSHLDTRRHDNQTAGVT